MFWLLAYFMLGATCGVVAVRGMSEGWTTDKRLGFADFLPDLACAFLIAAMLMAGTVNTRIGGCSMPGQVYISGSGFSTDVGVSAQQNSNGVPQAPSNNIMNVLIPITVGMVAAGAAVVAIPVVDTVAVTSDVTALVGTTAIRGSIIGGVTLATLTNCIGGDVSLGSNGQMVALAVATSVGDVGFSGHQWYCSFGNVAGGGTAYDANLDAAYVAVLPTGGLFKYAGIGIDSNTGALCGMATSYSSPSVCYAAYLYSTDRHVTGYVASGSSCIADPTASRMPATNAQIQNVIRAHLDSWPSIYNDMNCGPTLALTNGSTPDPCYRLCNDPCTGFGVSFSTDGSSRSNNGYAASSTSCPSATVTTVPTTDTQTKTNADGSKTIANTATTRTTAMTGTNGRTNLVVGRTTAATTTAMTATNTNDSTTATMKTTTDRAPPQTGTNTN